MPTSTRQLTPERIAAAALDLLDRDGLDMFSMRRLADSLRVGTMTLYGYFPSKSALLDGVMDESAARFDIAELGDSWRDRAGGLARAWRANLERHPALVEIRMRRPMVRPSQFRSTEVAVRALRDAGLPPAEAARAFRVLFTYVFGFAAFSPSGGGDDARRELRGALASLPADEYPTLTSMVDEAVDAAAGDDQFEWGLDLVLDGIELRASRR